MSERNAVPNAAAIEDQRQVDHLRAALSAALKEALKARDQVGIRSMRTALGALDNATAVEETAEHVETWGRPSDVPRRVVTFAECREILSREVSERIAAAEQAEAHGRATDGARLRDEAARISAFLAWRIGAERKPTLC
jgi:uncharacterized protein YqeY